MPVKKQTTKKAAVKKIAKTATKTEPTVVVEVPDFKNPQVLRQLYEVESGETNPSNFLKYGFYYSQAVLALKGSRGHELASTRLTVR